MKHRKTIGVVVAVAILLLTVILTDIGMVFQQTRRQTKDSGIYQLENISGDLEEMIADSEKLTLQIAIEAREYLDDRDALRQYIYEKKDEITSGDIGAFNMYIAGDGWFIIPGFDDPGDFVASERVWFQGAVRNGGTAYVTSPYQDVVTGKICYTVSVMLADEDTVLGVDYNIDTIQAHIAQMYDTDSHNAVIVTDEGVIAGCSDESLIGQKLADVVPEYAGIYAASKNAEDVSIARIKSKLLYENLFAAKSGNGWYLIVSESDWELYRSSYIGLFVTLFLALSLFVVVIVLYLFALKSQVRAEEAMQAKEEFLNSITGKLREPLARILNSSSRADIENAREYSTEMERIHTAGEILSEMIGQLMSYSSIVRKGQHENTGHKKKEIRETNKRYRTMILIFMIFIMIVSQYMNLTVSYRWGNEKMRSKADSYDYELSEWIDTQKSILNMFVSTISTNPEMLDDYEKTIDYLNRITVQYPEISVTYMANPELNPSVYMNNGWKPDAGWHVEERQWYQDTLASEDGFSVSAPYYDVQTGGYCLTISECVYDSKTGDFLGIFGIDFFMDKLVEILGDSYTEQGYAFMVDAAGDIVNHPFGSYQMSEESMANVYNMSYGEIIPDGEDTKLIRDYDGSVKILLAEENKASGFTVYVVSSIWPIYGRVFIYGLFCMAFFLTCIVLIYRLLTSLIVWQEDARRQLKEAADTAVAAGKAKSQFLAQMSHEIRTPINAVLGMNEMIMREASDDTIQDYSENIQLAGKNLLSLINDILDFSKIEDGKMEIIPVKYKMSELVTSLVNEISARAENKGLELVTNIDESLPSELYGDEVRIKQVITNILTNAVKYTEKGRITFYIGFERLAGEPDGILLHIAVKDTGIGIKPEDMKKLFSEFERIDEEHNRNIEGTGLGMSITQSLLTMMGTTLKVDSVYGEGSTFSFALKQKVVSWKYLGDYETDYLATVRKKRKYSAKFTAANAHVLVVDDNNMNLMVFTSLLKKTRVKIDTAADGDTGLELTRKKKYDIIFLDHMMPGKDGIETLKEMQGEKNNPNLSTPVICLTANAITGAREEYMTAGFNDYLTKPIDFSKLEDMMIEYLPDSLIEHVQEVVEETALDIPNELTALKGQKLINMDVGIENASSIEDYMLLLRIFYESLNEKAEEINRYYKTEDYHNYTIKVHALKSSARIIGAVEFGDEAQRLENAGKQGDIEYIRNHHEAFMLEYKQFSGLLAGVFEGARKETEKPAADPQMMKEAYEEIRIAAEEMDCERLDMVFQKMAEYSIPQEEEELFAKLVTASGKFEYETITRLLHEQ